MTGKTKKQQVEIHERIDRTIEDSVELIITPRKSTRDIAEELEIPNTLVHRRFLYLGYFHDGKNWVRKHKESHE